MRGKSGGIILRLTQWGVISGAILGCLYAILLVVLPGSAYLADVAAVVGLSVGCLLGLGLGALNGIVLATITEISLHRNLSVTHYRTIARVASVIVTALGSWASFSAFGGASQRDIIGWIVYPLTPTLIAVGVGLTANTRVIYWVENQNFDGTIDDLGHGSKQ